MEQAAAIDDGSDDDDYYGVLKTLGKPWFRM